jgi:hypothetical protein
MRQNIIVAGLVAFVVGGLMVVSFGGLDTSQRAAVTKYFGSTTEATDTAWQNARASYDAKLAKSLRFEQIAAQLAVNHWHRELRPYAMSDHPPAALLDSLGAAKVRLDLADRAVNRFMGCGSASGN